MLECLCASPAWKRSINSPILRNIWITMSVNGECWEIEYFFTVKKFIFIWICQFSFATFVIRYMLTIYFLSSLNFNLKPDFDLTDNEDNCNYGSVWLNSDQERNQKILQQDVEYFQKCTTIMTKIQTLSSNLRQFAIGFNFMLNKSSGRLVC